MMRALQVVLIVALGAIAGCGPGGGEANVKVSVSDSTEADGTVLVPSPDTVVRTDTVLTPQPPDTVTRTVIVPTDTGSARQPQPGTTPPASTISIEERQQIDAWLRANADSLNQYGDPKDMMYTGGTPLFDERTGTRRDLYEYIVSQHPDRPWRSMKK